MSDNFRSVRRLAVISGCYLALSCGAMILSSSAMAQSSELDVQTNQDGPEQTWTVNFKETDIQELIRFVGKASGRTIIIDDRVRGKVQVISAKPLNSTELYDLFLSILDIYGFAAVESGGVTRIIPAKDARTAPVPVLKDVANAESSEIITEVIQLENISAAKLIPVLRPLAPQQAHMAAYAPSNAIIVSDTSANIRRIKKVIENIDLSAVSKTDIIPLEHASAEELVLILDRLQKVEEAKGQAETKQLILVSDKRTNSVLVTGDELGRQRVRTLVKHLDTPLTHSGNVKVVYLEYAEAPKLAEVLSKVVQNMDRMAGRDVGKKAAANKSATTIEADEGTNSLIVTAEADVMASLMAVIERLDIRRAQVLVEAIIVEMSDDDTRNLGVDWLFLNNNGGYGSSTTNGVGAGIASAAFGSDSDDDDFDARPGLAAALAGTQGAVLGIGRLDDDLSFNAVINALQGDTRANILSTPSLLTLDNEEASITVGQNIPFVTGSFTSTGNGSSNPQNPFQTVERENVGITLKVTPQINEGDSLVLALSQEVSNVLQGAGSVNGNLITSERKIETKVLVDNAQIVVLGGLIEDSVSETVSKVPLLGSIPVLGHLFKNTTNISTKKHLLVFMKPTILRDQREMDYATAQKYRRIREEQLKEIDEGVGLMEDSTLPLLPEWREQLEQLEEIRRQRDGEKAKVVPIDLSTKAKQ